MYYDKIFSGSLDWGYGSIRLSSYKRLWFLDTLCNTEAIEKCWENFEGVTLWRFPGHAESHPIPQGKAQWEWLQRGLSESMDVSHSHKADRTGVHQVHKISRGGWWQLLACNAGQCETVAGALENECMPALRGTSERYKSCSTRISNDILVVCKSFHQDGFARSWVKGLCNSLSKSPQIL